MKEKIELQYIVKEIGKYKKVVHVYWIGQNNQFESLHAAIGLQVGISNNFGLKWENGAESYHNSVKSTIESIVRTYPTLDYLNTETLEMIANPKIYGKDVIQVKRREHIRGAVMIHADKYVQQFNKLNNEELLEPIKMIYKILEDR